MTIPIWEVMLRGNRLHQARQAGVPQPHLIVRTEIEYRQALLAAQKPRPAGKPREPWARCAWCGQRCRGQVCYSHRDVENALQEWLNPQ